MRRPFALGSKLTLNVVLPPAATVVAGCTVTVKSAAFVPETVTRLVMFSVAVPVF